MATGKGKERRERRKLSGRDLLRSDQALVLTEEGEDYLAKGLFEGPTSFKNLLLAIRGQGPIRPSELVESWGSRNVSLLGRAIERGYVEGVSVRPSKGEVDWEDISRQFRESGGI